MYRRYVCEGEMSYPIYPNKEHVGYVPILHVDWTKSQLGKLKSNMYRKIGQHDAMGTLDALHSCSSKHNSIVGLKEFIHRTGSRCDVLCPIFDEK